MGICPNCGSWVDEGDICNNCGGSGYCGYEDEPDDSIYYYHYYAKAERLREKGMYHEALDVLDDFLDTCSRSEIWDLKGSILCDVAGENPDEIYAESIRCYDRALEERYTDTYANNKSVCLSQWAWNLIDRHEYQPAMEKADEAISLAKKDQDHAYALNAKGVVCYKLGNYENALQYYDMAIEYDPDYNVYKNNKAICLCDLGWKLIDSGNYNLALETVSRGICLFAQKDLDYAYALNAIAVIYNRVGNHDMAMQYYDMALEHDPENEIYRQNKRNYEKAVDFKYKK